MSEECSGNEFDGRLGLRISSIFVILVGSTLGACFPVFAANHKSFGSTSWMFFIAKYFGSGVIVATAFIHLLAPAHEALTNECLTGPITEYPWVEGIALMTVFLLFFVEIMAMRYARFGHDHGHNHPDPAEQVLESASKDNQYRDDLSISDLPARENEGRQSQCPAGPYMPGDDHLSHARDHEIALKGRPRKTFDPESYEARMTALFILEFGVIFHSVFIGLTLAVSGAEFITLYIVLSFHQTFEGLALGSRLGSIEWPSSKKFVPYILGLGYGLSTPIAIAIGLGVRETLSPNSPTTLIVNGVFDSISAGILIYTGLVEIMAHEFVFNAYMNEAPVKVVLSAFAWMVLGAALMALLGKWA